MPFVVVRLGKDSTTDINNIDSGTATLPFSFTFECAQVEEGIDAGDYVFIWLGSDNNKGQPTAWKQGLRAVGKILSLARGASFNDQSQIEIEVFAVLPRSIDQFDFLERSASHYKYFSKYPVVGVRSSRNNAIQKAHEGDLRQQSAALLTSVCLLFPELKEKIVAAEPDLAPLLEFVPLGNLDAVSKPSPIDLSADPVWQWINYEIFTKGEHNFLFLGAPGTGKSWYAHEIAEQISGGDPDRKTVVQFHPSYSYDDFIEGYVPGLDKTTSSVRYSIQRKHFLDLCDKARGDGGSKYVIVVDELSRGDPSRVFGEILTYIEGSYRNKEFALAYSRDKTYVPDNVILIATANPYDRSVSELDDALLRRFTIREFPPNATLLEKHLLDAGVAAPFVQRLIHVFNLINGRLPNGFGHAHFWNVRNESDFRKLWDARVSFLLKRAFMFETEILEQLRQEVDGIFPLEADQPEQQGETGAVVEAAAGEAAAAEAVGGQDAQ